MFFEKYMFHGVYFNMNLQFIPLRNIFKLHVN